MQDSIKNALNWRYAIKEFNKDKLLEQELFDQILEAGRLAPSSNGFEPWKFIVVDNPEVRAQLREVAYDQPKVTDAPKLVVLAYRTDPDTVIDEVVARNAKAQGVTPEELTGFREYLHGVIGGENGGDVERYFEKQVYIPLGMMIETAALLGVDAGPMSGFVPAKVDEILGLKEKNLKSTALLALGYRAVDADRPKTRQTTEEVTITVS
jgi:nitroreductase/dihydropteridine reductase